MQEIVISTNQAKQRFDKFLKRYFSEAENSFIYKMLRKKNITLNNSKASGSEILSEGDVVKLFLSDETIAKFHVVNNTTTSKQTNNRTAKSSAKDNNHIKLDIIFEDSDIILANKPVGVLSQKSTPSDYSINEMLLDYLIANGSMNQSDFADFKPSVCNRLDRNTSGIIAFGKSRPGTRLLTDGFRDRSISKYYICIVKGIIKDRQIIDGYLVKDEKSNKVTVSKKELDNSDRICTEYIPFSNNKEYTLLKIKLHTGKTHQIRAHLASIGCPLIGDYKYGNNKVNEYFNSKYKLKSQFLHAFEVMIPQKELVKYANIPAQFQKILKEEMLWEPGKQGDLEALH